MDLCSESAAASGAESHVKVDAGAVNAKVRAAYYGTTRWPDAALLADSVTL